MTTPEAVIEEAKTWLRTPFHHHAAIKGVGVDCAHLLRAVYVAAGAVEHFEIQEYPADWFMHKHEEIFAGYMDACGARLVDEKPKPADVVLYRFGHCFSHGAIVVEWPLIIHAYFRAGMVCYATGDAEDIGRQPRRVYRVLP